MFLSVDLLWEFLVVYNYFFRIDNVRVFVEKNNGKWLVICSICYSKICCSLCLVFEGLKCL